MAALFIFTSSLAVADENCDSRLSSRAGVNSVVQILLKAYAKKILQDSDLKGFVGAKVWTNPFLTSADHLLRPQYKKAFDELTGELSEVEQKEVRKGLTRELVNIVSLQEMSAVASQETATVIAPREVMHLSTNNYLRLQGFKTVHIRNRTALISHAQGRDHVWKHVLLDPNNPAPENRFLEIPSSEDWIDEEPVVAIERGRETIGFPLNKRVLDLDTKSEKSAQVQAHPAPPTAEIRPAISVQQKRDEISFYIGDKLISRTTIRNNKATILSAKVFVEGNQRVAIIVYDLDNRHSVRVFNIDTKEKKTFKDMSLASFVIFRNGEPYLVSPIMKGNDCYFRFIRIADKTVTDVQTQGFVMNVELIRLQGREHLIWREETQMGLLDTWSAEILYVPGAEVKKQWGMQFYEFENRKHVIFGTSHLSIYELTRPGRETR